MVRHSDQLRRREHRPGDRRPAPPAQLRRDLARPRSRPASHVHRQIRGGLRGRHRHQPPCSQAHRRRSVELAGRSSPRGWRPSRPCLPGDIREPCGDAEAHRRTGRGVPGAIRFATTTKPETRSNSGLRRRDRKEANSIDRYCSGSHRSNSFGRMPKNA